MGIMDEMVGLVDEMIYVTADFLNPLATSISISDAKTRKRSLRD